MNREERRVEQKSRKRKLQWLERESKHDNVIHKVVTEIEASFDENEVENAKAFVVDYLTNSGIFSQFGDRIDSESLDKISHAYGLEPVDGMFILDTVEDIFSAEKGEGG